MDSCGSEFGPGLQCICLFGTFQASREEKSSEVRDPDHFYSKGPARKVLRPVTVALFFGKELVFCKLGFLRAFLSKKSKKFK